MCQIVRSPYLLRLGGRLRTNSIQSNSEAVPLTPELFESSPWKLAANLPPRRGPGGASQPAAVDMQSRRLLALIVLLLRSVDATTWIVDPSTGSEYTVVAQSGKRFTRCESACSAIGSSMPCIRTSGESDFVRKKVADGDNFWIGLYQQSLCSWKWTSSSCNPNDFDDWVPGQPNNVRLPT